MKLGEILEKPLKHCIFNWTLYHLWELQQIPQKIQIPSAKKLVVYYVNLSVFNEELLKLDISLGI